jgi:hypothetical protein
MLAVQLIIVWAFFLTVAAGILFVAFPTANRLNRLGSSLETFWASAAVRLIRKSASGIVLFFFAAVFLLVFLDFCAHLALRPR